MHCPRVERTLNWLNFFFFQKATNVGRSSSSGKSFASIGRQIGQVTGFEPGILEVRVCRFAALAVLNPRIN